MQQYQQQLKRPSVQKLFSGYYHDETVAQMQKKDGPTSFGMGTSFATTKNETTAPEAVNLGTPESAADAATS